MPGPPIDIIPLVADGEFVKRVGSTLSSSSPAELAAESAFTGAFAPSVLDEDDFATNSATRPPSQQSVAAYIAASFVPMGVFVKPIVGRVLPQIPGPMEITTADETLDRLYLWPIPVPFPVEVSTLYISIATAGASATPRLGLYAVAADGRPGDLIVDGGTVDASTSGQKTATLGAPVNITQGLVYGAVAWQGAVSGLRYVRHQRPFQGTGPTWIGGSGIALPTTAATAGTQYANGFQVSSISGALPTTPITGSTAAVSISIPSTFNILVSGLL